MNLEKHVYDFLIQEGLMDQKIGIAVSGGIDSMTLLSIIEKLCDPKHVFVLHIDHGFRTKSKQEWKSVEELCKSKNFSFLGHKIASLPQKNREAAWRKERKNFFEKCVQEYNLKRVLTAHHATDLVETMIWRLTKGCGISGLAPFDVQTKPLWNVSREEIKTYAQTNNVDWSEDESNQDTDMERNLIRHEVLPKLRKITPNLEQVFVRESLIFNDIHNFIEKSLPALKPIERKKFLEWDPTLQKEFLRRISKKIPSASEIEDFVRWIKNDPRGNTEKELGGTKFMYREKILSWEDVTPPSLLT